MEQRDSGAIPGIHGRLGDLGAIDEKYDVAISTACRALDHIVVDSMDTAMKCVEFLKKRNVGLATFIGLDKVCVWVWVWVWGVGCGCGGVGGVILLSFSFRLSI